MKNKLFIFLLLIIITFPLIIAFIAKQEAPNIQFWVLICITYMIGLAASLIWHSNASRD